MAKAILRIALVFLAALVAGTAPWAQERESPEVYRSRRTALQDKLRDGIFVLFGKSEDPGDEILRPFRQENYFYYLTGVNQPGGALLLAPPVTDRRSPFWDESQRLPREILFLPARGLEREQWTGPKLDPYDPATLAQTGFAAIQAMEAFESELRRFAQGYPALYTLLPNPHATEMERLEENYQEKLRAILPLAKIRDARAALTDLRQVKSESELKLIGRAVDCSIEAHGAAARELRPGLFEYEIAALMKYTFERAGCERPAFPPIVGSGPRSTILHYNRNSARMEAGELVVMDVAGEYAHYAADITRTLPLSGRFTARQREIYEIVLGAQKAALQAVKPGMSLARRGSNSLYQIAYNYINSHGKDRHGERLGKYFTHGLGHHVGLEVHDPGDLNLEAWMVITIEPGIYLPEENLGVRIEDMVLVTQDGHVLLTERLPREVDAIENWMRKQGPGK